MTAFLPCVVVGDMKLAKKSRFDDEKHEELVLELEWEGRVPGD